MQVERELKFRLGRRVPERLARLARRTSRVASIYYDTSSQALRRAGMALRLRRVGSRWLQTLKCDRGGDGGFSARAEWELPVRGAALEVAAFPRGEILAATGVDLARLRRRLHPLFETRFTRRSGVVALPGGGHAELAIDQGYIAARGQRLPIRELELELKSGPTLPLLRYAKELELPLAYESKAERGYRLAAGERVAPRRWRMPVLVPNEDLGAAFAVLFRAAMTQAGANVQGVVQSRDPEYLHQLRVGLRRLSALLHAFAPELRRAGNIRRPLGEFLNTLGAARDWDVLLPRVPRAAAARRRAAAARRAAQALVDSPTFHRFLLHALAWLEEEPCGRSTHRLRAFAARALGRLHKALHEGRIDGASGRHKLRIRLKRLRYACEFFSPCFSPSAPARYLAAVKGLQDLLGELNDIAVGRRLLQEAGVQVPAGFARRERRLRRQLAVDWAAFCRARPFWRARRPRG